VYGALYVYGEKHLQIIHFLRGSFERKLKGGRIILKTLRFITGVIYKGDYAIHIVAITGNYIL
jgi:hypothetical protein